VEREREREREVPIDMVGEALWDGIMREGGMRRKSCAQSTLDSCLLAEGFHHSKVPSPSCSNIISKTEANLSTLLANIIMRRH
jgi:hypothetical protein